MIWGFVGGRDFDAHSLTALLESVPPTDTIIVGSGVGSEKFVREQAVELGKLVKVAPLRTDLYLKNDVLPLQVTDVVISCIGGKLVLMGGGRAKIAADIVKRCQSTARYNNERERIQHGVFWEVVEL